MTTDQRKPFAPTRPGRYELRNEEVITLIGNDQHGRWIEGGRSFGIWAADGNGGLSRFDVIGFSPDDRAWCLARARELAEAHGFVVAPSEATDAWFDAQQAFYAAVPSHQHGHMEWCERMEAALKVIAASATGAGK